MKTPADPHPTDAIAAVTHADPYPWYATLQSGPPLFFDASLGLWIASSARQVEALLVHPSMRVRPSTEAVPRSFSASPAGEVFGYLIRMSDGPGHASLRPVLQAGLAAIDAGRTRAAVEVAAAQLPDRNDSNGEALQHWCRGLPVRSVAWLLGFAPDRLAEVDAWTQDFVACLSPLASKGELETAGRAAAALMSRFEALCYASPANREPHSGVLLATLLEGRAKSTGSSRALLANLVGLLSQTCEATAALLANSWVALVREPRLPQLVMPLPRQSEALVAEVARHDAPVQNTRRFVAERTLFEGVRLDPGDAVLLVLAAANRDPELNPAPATFALDRPARRHLGFGHGTHRCPGQAMAFGIAAAGVEALLDRGFDPRTQQCRGWHYRPSVNVRLPVFH